jgi:hypothetical protein
MEGGNIIMGLKTIVNQQTFGYGMRKKYSFRLSLLMLFYMDTMFWDVIYLDNCRER